jgi:chromosome segregation ATPase
MKHPIITVALLSVAAIATSCSPSDNASTDKQIDKVKAETKAVAQDVKDYTFAQRAAFTENMKIQMNQINKDIDELDANLEKASDAVKAEAKPKLQALRDQEAQLSKQLEAIKDANETTWGEFKSGANKALDGLKEGFKQSRQWVSDKIAP